MPTYLQITTPLPNVLYVLYTANYWYCTNFNQPTLFQNLQESKFRPYSRPRNKNLRREKQVIETCISYRHLSFKAIIVRWGKQVPITPNKNHTQHNSQCRYSVAAASAADS